ncbi:hypothetical protein HMPREF0349_0183 [Enterococcus faecalis TX1322]|nr:hypothetical protein HMPREF0349_0183 [Enterococcus faecalis TX1322]EFE20654.1 hypothetical protein HMPREF9376_00303 [Enterococcus faecalis S613]EFQ09380.1 hypothetical protein HMPREF9492_02322 [Enterococcus faecalis DAPTO 512]EFQ67171.1 hypothetical protein HMPREF9493_02067 [Enterococcus faecalis DAPTO 516]
MNFQEKIKKLVSIRNQFLSTSRLAITFLIRLTFQKTIADIMQNQQGHKIC